MSKPLPTHLNFDEELVREIPVTYNKKSYVFREPTLDAARKASNIIGKNQVVNEQGKVIKLDNAGDVPMHVVSGCLFEKMADGKERQVLINELITWPLKYIMQLMEVYKAWDEELKDPKDVEETAKN